MKDGAQPLSAVPDTAETRDAQDNEARAGDEPADRLLIPPRPVSKTTHNAKAAI